MSTSLQPSTLLKEGIIVQIRNWTTFIHKSFLLMWATVGLNHYPVGLSDEVTIKQSTDEVRNMEQNPFNYDFKDLLKVEGFKLLPFNGT